MSYSKCSEELSREEKKKKKTEKKLHKEKEIEELEKLHKLNVVRKFYRNVSNARVGFKPRINTCKAKDGTILSDQQYVLNC